MSDRETEVLEREISAAEAEFVERLRAIDPDLIAHIGIGRGLPGRTLGSEWHDNWRDRDRWVKSFGKAGVTAGFDHEDFVSNFQNDEAE